MTKSLPSSLLARAAALFAALAVLFVTGGLPAHAAPRVEVDSPLGGDGVSSSSATTVTLRGSGFQSIQKGFGGIYVMFGWVGDGWRPSAGGKAGTNYRYVPDSEQKDNRGYVRFVSFPGSETESAANGGKISANGTWSTTLTIPGPLFNSVDRNGKVSQVDCRKVRCGIITVGAHGVHNARNESFTPVRFISAAAKRQAQQPTTSQKQPAQTQSAQKQPATAASPAAPAPTAPAPEAQPRQAAQPQGGGPVSQQPAAPAGSDAQAVAPGDSETAPVEAAGAPLPGPAQKPTLGLAAKQVTQGQVLSFTGNGFLPGEQVVATLDTGTSAGGPYTAGKYGDIAGTAPLPADMRPGTHVLSLSGAASQETARISFTVEEPAAVTATKAAAESGIDGWGLAAVVAGSLAVLVLIVLVVAAITAFLRKRRSTPALSALLGLTLVLASLAGPAPSSFADETDSSQNDGIRVSVTIPGATPAAEAQKLTNASLVWGINPESSSGSFFGGCNFLVAGKVGNMGRSHAWSDAELNRVYRAQAGNVALRKGGKAPSVADRCKTSDGRQVTTNPSDMGTGTQLVFSGGTGSIETDAQGRKSATVRWDGAFSVVFYGGLTYWWAENPVLRVNPDGTGTLTATVGGWASAMDDTSKWQAVPSRTVQLATLSGVQLSERGFSITPDYRGRKVNTGKAQAQATSGANWGAFPQDFVDFQIVAGQSSYWYSSGGSRDAAKPPSPLTVSWDAAKPQAPVAGGTGNGGSTIGQPTQPGVPGQEGGVITQPQQPGEFLPGDAGAVPVQPATPAQPQQPGQPGTSGGSGAVSQPQQPAQPLQPGQPAQPGQPVQPGAPDGAGSSAGAPESVSPAVSPIWVGASLIPAATSVATTHPALALALSSLLLLLCLLLAAGLKRGWLVLPGTGK
ncbi:hypothetical protein ACUH97_05420 [Dermabacteraceae bacterium P13088]